MFGRGGAPVEAQIRFLEGEKAKIHDELAALHHLREMARHDEIRAMAMLESAHANQLRVERQTEEKLEAIISLQREIADLIPPQPGPVDWWIW